MTLVRTYREIFGIGEFRALFVSRCAFMAGVVIGGLALGTVMYQTTGSPLLTALAMFGGPLVQLVTSHFLLAGSDLMRPRTAIVLVGVTAGATDFLQLIPGLPVWCRFALLAVGYVVAAATGGTVMALLGDIVPPDAFVLGRSALNITVGGMQIIGNAIGAILLLWLSATNLFVLSGGLSLLGAALARWRLADHPPRGEGRIVDRTRSVNRALLGSAVVRPIYVMSWLPNGLVVGCEAMFIPYAGTHGGWLLGAAAGGMLAGDIVIGRFVPEHVRDRLIVPLRVVLGVGFLPFALHPPVWLAALLAAAAAFGYPAALPLQERLVHETSDDVRGQVFGLYGTGLMVGQALGATIAGAVAQSIGGGSVGAGRVAALMAGASLVASAALLPGLRRSDPRRLPGRSAPQAAAPGAPLAAPEPPGP